MIRHSWAHEYSLTISRSGWDMHDMVYSRELGISNKQNGYRDVLAKIDLSTFRRIPWDNNVPFFLVSYLDPVTQVPLYADPRGVLRTACEQAAAHNFSCMAGVEYEVCVFVHDVTAASQLSQFFNFKGKHSVDRRL